MRGLLSICRLHIVRPALVLGVVVMVVGAVAHIGGATQVRGSGSPLTAAGNVLTNTLFLPVVSRPLMAYHDSFDDPNSGWYVGAALRYNNFCDWVDGAGGCKGLQEVAYMNYANGNYRFYIPLTWHGGGSVDTWFVWPIQAAPLSAAHYPLPDSYCVSARGRFSSFEDKDYQPWWAHWGIVFGADAAMTEVYTLQVNANHDMAVLLYKNYVYPGNRTLGGGEVNAEIPLVNWSGDMWDLIPTHRYNTLKVAVKGQLAYVYVNGKLMNIVSVRGMPRGNVGLIGGSWEVTPVQIDVSDFYYDPFCTD